MAESRIAELASFYAKHNPEKAGDAESLIKGYPLEALVASLEAKYGKAVVAAELPSFVEAAAAANAKEEEARMRQITDKLERTSVEDFATFTEQLADMQACMAEGGTAAVKAKHKQTEPMSEEQLASMITGMQEVADLGAKAAVGTKVGEPAEGETFTVTANVEIPKDKAVGDTFTITLPNGADIPITVPEGANPGDVIQLNIQVPKDQEAAFKGAAEAAGEGGAAAPPAPPAVAGETFTVTANVEIPKGKAVGDTFTITLPNGADIPITVPEGANPGDVIRLNIDVPKDQEKAFQDAEAEGRAESGASAGAAAATEGGAKPADIDTVMQQTGISRAEAIKALVENDNDVVEAIMVIEEAAEEAAAE